jgi:GNAT superfamily N-acetyltransferase
VISVERLQAYMREVMAREREIVATPPFTIFFDTADNRTFCNYAIPDAPVAGDLSAPLAALRVAFAAHGRRPRFEFVAEFAPDLAPALRANGFAEESCLHLMVCTPATYRPAPDVPGLTITTLDSETPIAAIRENLDTNERGFDPRAAPVTEAEVRKFRAELITSRAFTAYIDGQPAGAGMFTPPLDGLTELVGIATLEPFRGRGVAAALTAQAVATAFGRGVEVAFLSAADARAGRVYERVGFRPFATLLAYIDELRA